MKSNEIRRIAKDITATEEKQADDILKQVADVIKESGKPMVDLRKPLEDSGLFKKNDIDFSHQPYPMFTIKYKGKKIAIVNKNNVDVGHNDIVVDKVVVGYL